eukprot:3104374-Amphidinium_carterae.1
MISRLICGDTARLSLSKTVPVNVSITPNGSEVPASFCSLLHQRNTLLDWVLDSRQLPEFVVPALGLESSGKLSLRSEGAAASHWSWHPLVRDGRSALLQCAEARSNTYTSCSKQIS